MEGNWLDLKLFAIVPGVVVGIVAAFFSLRKLLGWWRPIRISTATHHVFDGTDPDQIIGTITNVSAEDQVLVECKVRTAYPIRTALFKHARRPLTPVRLYSTIWFGAICFDLMGPEPIRFVPKERRELSYALSDHPLCLFVTPEILIEAKTSEGRKFRSKRISVPENWRLGHGRKATTRQ